MKLSDAARKSIIACVSDFAAKGIKPQYGIISVCLPKTISRTKINEIAYQLGQSYLVKDLACLVVQ